MSYNYDRTAASEINWSVVHQVASKAMRAMGRPASSRKGALKQIVDAVAGNDILMNAFASIFQEHGSLDYHSVADLIGRGVMQWKEDWEIMEDETYEELTMDSALVKGIQAVVAKWSPKGPLAQPRDFAEASMLVSQHRGLADLLKGLAEGSSRDEEKDRLEVLRRIELVEKLLK